MTRPSWYAVAYDVAGGVAAQEGPLTWTEARDLAIRMETREHVRYAIVLLRAGRPKSLLRIQ